MHQLDWRDSGSQALTGFLCRNHEHTENNRFLWATLPCNQPDGRNDLPWNFIRNPLTAAQTAIGSSFTVLNVCRESYASYPFKECLDCGTSDRTYREFSRFGRR